MALSGFKAKNHPQQVAKAGGNGDVEATIIWADAR